jgi:hypothetical protein
LGEALRFVQFSGKITSGSRVLQVNGE